MSMTGLPVFDETVHASNTWLREITSRLGWDDRQKGYRVLRTSLHAMRAGCRSAKRRISAPSCRCYCVACSSRAGVPRPRRRKARPVEDFLSRLRAAFEHDPEFDAEAAFREVVSVMRFHVSPGAIEDVRRVMPEALKGLWDEEVLG